MTGIRAGCGGARRVDRTRATTVADHPGKAFRRMRVGIRSARAGALAAMMMGAMAHAAPMFVVAGCDIPVVDEATRGRLRCGTVSVPRDPDHPQAGTIGLAVVVRRSAAPTPGAGACPRGIVAGFIADPTKAPDAACLASMNAPPFLLDARPLPAAVALAAAIESGRLPGAAPAAIAGLGLLLVAGVLVPTARWLRQRRSRIPAVASGGRAPRALALAGGLCGVGGAVLPMLGTLHGHPGAAAFGLDPTLALGLWALPFGLALSVQALVLAARRGQAGAAVAAVGGLLVSGAPLLLGLVPWH